MAPEVVVIRTGSANLASVASALERLGANPRLSDDATLVREAARVILPGVGAFGAGMRYLRERGLDDAVRERISLGRPTLAICLGMQLLCARSEESPEIAGLSVVSETVRRFGDQVLVPQMGWNRIEPTADAVLLRPAWMYFANSYRLDRIPEGWAGAVSEHGGPFAAAIERGPVLACQFHPELSGPEGLALIERWIIRGSEAIAC